MNLGSRDPGSSSVSSSSASPARSTLWRNDIREREKRGLPLDRPRVNVDISEGQILNHHPPLPLVTDPQRGARPEADRPEVRLRGRDGRGGGCQGKENSRISHPDHEAVFWCDESASMIYLSVEEITI